MPKPEFVFHWYETPRHVGKVTRAEMAELFRTYRRRRNLYRLYRLGPGVYHVSLRAYEAIGVFTVLEPVKLVSGKELSHG